MDHNSNNTASQSGQDKDHPIQQGHDETEASAAQEETGATDSTLDDGYTEMIDTNLAIFKGQFGRLKEAIHDHTVRIRAGADPDKDVNEVIKRFEPLITQSMQQEIKIHEKLAQRLGQAGKHAVDIGSARTEVGRRLARLRDARGNR